MADLEYKSYTGRWGQSKYMTVDAPSMDIAAEKMHQIKGSDPITIVTWKDDILLAHETDVNANVRAYVKYIGSDKHGPPFGDVYPSNASVPINDIVILTAVPANEEIQFVGYTDENGNELGDGITPEYWFRVKQDTIIYANFTDGVPPRSGYTFDENQFQISAENMVSLKTTDELTNSAFLVPTSRAVHKEMEKKIESITVNDKPVDIKDKTAMIDLSQDYLYEHDDIDFSSLID